MKWIKATALLMTLALLLTATMSTTYGSSSVRYGSTRSTQQQLPCILTQVWDNSRSGYVGMSGYSVLTN